MAGYRAVLTGRVAASPGLHRRCGIGACLHGHAARLLACRPITRHSCRSRSQPALALRNYSQYEKVSNIKIHDNGVVVDEGDQTPFKKILCANRGEIAVRVFRAGTELGLRTVAIYSESDRLQPHRYKADESYAVGPPDAEPVQSYLDIEGIIQLAKQQEVDCIHPGYGFLSENSTFARRCDEEGITFIGPLPETIAALGDKTRARALAQECGVPVVPGTDAALKTSEEAHAFAEKAGFPIILKASMGGGGRGMRVVHKKEELDDAFNRASNEALASFGDGSMFAERFVKDPRHVEVQILADTHGNVVHLHERDCSVQRRHQKVVELAPAYGLDPKIRDALHADAIKIAKHVGYRNAGTVEFMVEEGGYYFLEVNPRVQVEHTVTEEVTGIDIVQSQIKIAGGATLESIGIGSQEAVGQPLGYALQCRITCEDPATNFQPDTGRIAAYRSPGGPGIRLDGALGAGNTVSRFYDSLLVKVICHGKTYIQAVQKMQRALYEFHIRGVKTNIGFLENVLRHPEFLSGTATTSFIERNPQLISGLAGQQSIPDSSKVLTYLGELVVNGPDHAGAVGPPPNRLVPDAPVPPSWPPPAGWRDVLAAEGPAGFAKAVREHKGVLITDTTWRDAHQSLLATRMRTHDLLKAAPFTAHALAGAMSLECWGGATFDVSLRFLHECPWRRLEQLREAVPNIPFQMLLRGANAVGYTTYADNVVKAFVKESVKAGMDIFRVFDSLNYLDNLKFGLDAVIDAGGVAEGTICYTGDISDPRKTKYTLDYYLEMADALVAHGVHTLCIKDMAGLLRPRAATTLITALRAQHPDVPIHVHTHDTAGTGVATQLACAVAGADVVDCAIDSMSGCTSQPSMGAIINGLAGTDAHTGIDPEAILPLIAFWEQTRGLYAPFEADMRAGSTDVYLHEMPGGQYTNLKFQAFSLGLGEQWEKVKAAYAAANRALGDIVKVTPSSKVVGDLAQFMVQNELTEQTLVERADTLAFPNSVVEYLQGMIGQPPFGEWPEPLRSKVLKDKPRVEGRPGASLPDVSFTAMEQDLRDKYNDFEYQSETRRFRTLLTTALYPKVYDEFRAWCFKYSAFTEKLPTRAFLVALEEDEEIEAQLSRGVKVSIKYKAVSEMQPNGKVEVFFEVNGVPRVVEVAVKAPAAAAGGPAAAVGRDKADPAVLGSVGAPMAGSIVDVIAKPGFYAKAGQALCVMSAMKMETAISAPLSGWVKHVAVKKGDSLEAGDLLVLMEEGDEPENPLKSLDSGDSDGVDDDPDATQAAATLAAGQAPS